MNARRVAGFVALLCCVANAQGQFVEPKPTIAVSGTAEIRVPPNEVNLKLGVESRDPKLEAAVANNDARTAAVLNFLRESGIEAKDIQTDFVDIQPHYNHERLGQQITPVFYLVRRNLGVRLRNVAQFDAVLTGALKSGVNHVDGIEFRTTELRKHRDAARQQAIRAAKEKALALAKELDVEVGKAQSIREQTGGGYSSWGGGRNYNAYASQNTVQAAGPAGDGGEGNLAVGMISVLATVDVTFLLE
jgi:uncharacterized protein YggE